MDETRFELIMTAKAAAGDAMKLTGVASSNARDLGGDAFAISALESMRDAFNAGKVPVMMDHKYAVADGQVFGRVLSSRLTPADANGIVDLVVTIQVSSSNEKAVRAYHQIAEGIPMGLSIGALVEEARVEKVEGKDTLVIRKCRLLEVSVVSLPAQPRAHDLTVTKALAGFLSQRSESKTKATADNALAALRLLTRLQAAQIEILTREVEEHRQSTHDLCEQVDAIMKTPVGRKIRPEVAAHFVDLQAKYPWLDSTIIDSLAKDMPQAARP